ncbi:hypothetical protein AVEN_136117-1, partial [Araneus ventricosus]
MSQEGLVGLATSPGGGETGPRQGRRQKGRAQKRPIKQGLSVEKADSLAKAATKINEVDFNVGIPKSWIKSRLKEVALQNWQERWENSLED